MINKLLISSMYFILGSLMVFAYAPYCISYLTIVVMVLLLLLLENQTKHLFFYSYIFALGFFGLQLTWVYYSLYYIIKTGWLIAVGANLLFVGYLALFPALAILLSKKLNTKAQFFNYCLLFPSLWTLNEWFRGWLFTGFPWGDLSYTQVNNSIFKGVFPVVGSYGVSWLTIFISGLLVYLLNNLHNIRIRNIVLINLTIFLLITNFLEQVKYTKQYGKPVEVALIQGNINQAQKWDNQLFKITLNDYENMIQSANAAIIILPETAIAQFAEDLPAGYLERLIKIANTKKASLLIGMPKLIDQNQNYVSAVVAINSIQSSYYAKYHLVPYGEYIPFKNILASLYNKINLPMVNFSSGNLNQKPLIIANQKLAFNICYENGFNAELIPNSKKSTVLINISDLVWFGPTIAQYQHLQISQARALENQRYFVQDTNTGISAIIAPDGHIQSQLRPFNREILTDYVVGYYGFTPFENYGNYPVIIFCILIILFGLLYLSLTSNNKIN